MRQIIPLALVSLVLLPAAASAAPCRVGDPFPYTMPESFGSQPVDPKIDCPANIQSWMNRVNICAHFAGEPPYDRERAEFIDGAMKENKCHQLGCEHEALYAEYEGDIVYAGVINGYLESIYGDTTSLPECEK